MHRVSQEEEGAIVDGAADYDDGTGAFLVARARVHLQLAPGGDGLADYTFWFGDAEQGDETWDEFGRRPSLEPWSSEVSSWARVLTKESVEDDPP